jgi:hypothetical protein
LSCRSFEAPKFKNLKQLEENVAAVNFGPLTAENLRDIEHALHSQA